MDFQKRLQKPDKTNILEQDGYYVWCGSAVKDGAGTYHLFASRWPKDCGAHAWVADSTIIRCEARSPEGPYTIIEELAVLKSQPWASEMAHNPTVKKIGDRYYLFYIGTAFNRETDPLGDNVSFHFHPARLGQRIGVAVADSPAGPWVPYENNPILSPREKGNWDSMFVTNPSILVERDGSVRLMYKCEAESEDKNVHVLMLGMAVAPRPEGPYERAGPSPLFPYDVEDPFIWEEDGVYWMLAKDMTGAIVEKWAGVLFRSDDAVNWKIAENKLAYNHTVEYADGSSERYYFVERPQLLLEDGKPVCLFTAVGQIKDGKAHFFNLARRVV